MAGLSNGQAPSFSPETWKEISPAHGADPLSNNFCSVCGYCFETLPNFLEFLESSRQPVSIGTVLTRLGSWITCPANTLEAKFEKRAIMNFEQPVGDVNAEIRADPD